jgi:alcohol dehydrogenase class IV
MSVNKRLQALSLRSCTSTEFAFMKAVEEMGELAKAVNQPERCEELDVSEAADAIIALQDFIYKRLREYGHSEKELKSMFKSIVNKKADKWETYLL